MKLQAEKDPIKQELDEQNFLLLAEFTKGKISREAYLVSLLDNQIELSREAKWEGQLEELIETTHHTQDIDDYLLERMETLIGKQTVELSPAIS